MKALRGPAGDGTEPEDEIDGDALGRYLSQQGHGSVRVRHSQTVSAGMSKKTVLVSIEGSETLPRDIALRVDRSANNYLGTTVTEEFGPLMKIWEGGARVPRPFLLEPTGEVIGDPFIVSEQVAGAPAGSIYFPPPGPNPELLHDVAAAMASVHAISPADWPRAGQPQGNAFFDRQFVENLEAWNEFNGASAIMDRAFGWIDEHRHLAYGPACIVHDDFAFNNILVKDNRATAVLDWEFAHVGTQAADIAYLLYAAEQMDSFSGFLEAYDRAGGSVPAAEQLAFYRLWGQLRLGVMGFKAVRNFEEGRFGNVRYAMCLVSRRMALMRIGNFLKEQDAL